MQKLIGIFFLLIQVASVGADEAPDLFSWNLKERDIIVDMRYPEGKLKALVLSFDDGMRQDLKLVELLNKYQLRGTFHLNSARLSMPYYLTIEEVKTAFKGHEISAHGVNHQGLTGLSRADMFYEFLEDRRALEAVSGEIIRGMAYPFGRYDINALDNLKSMGFEYARTVKATGRFDIPQNPLLWHPTAHIFANEKKPLNQGRTFQLAKEFLATESVSLLYLWGHSFEYVDKWKPLEALFAQLSDQSQVSYLTHIQLVDYLSAYRQLKISADKMTIHNPSAISVFLAITDMRKARAHEKSIVEIESGATITLFGAQK